MASRVTKPTRILPAPYCGTTAADLADRIERAVAELDRVDILPGVGRHWENCHLSGGHVDCFAVRLRHILTGGG